MEPSQYKMIHLLYVPTMACNMQCRYCYLKEHTEDCQSAYGCLETLSYAVDKFRESKVVPFNISLHGGEVTCLSQADFRELVAYISNYYEKNKNMIVSQGFPLPHPHIKTNLYGIDRHIDAIRDYRVIVSGSLDLPFSLHRKYRRTKDDQDTLDRIFKNVKLLKDLPNRKKVSATIFHEHYKHIEELIEDIRYLDTNTCLDMNAFNFMIGFAGENDLLTPLSHTEQVDFYRKIQKAFAGTHLEPGLQKSWFAEFTPDYCTGSDNCGEKFFLLERNGDIYSCVRGQGHPEFYYGNIYHQSVDEILSEAKRKIYEAHSSVPLNESCGKCSYIRYCRTGCPFVKQFYHTDCSYTCKLQQAIYEDHPEEYPASDTTADDVYSYVRSMHPGEVAAYRPQEECMIPSDIPHLSDLIEQDPSLALVYSPDAFIIEVGGHTYPLHSQIQKGKRDILYLCDEMDVLLYVKCEIMEQICDYPVNNSLYIMLLSGDCVTYGDEGRNKQEHIMTHQVYYRTLAAQPSARKGYYCLHLNRLLSLYKEQLSDQKPNNLFFTTQALRDYHYLKQKNNAYYHIQAMNLPFQNIEFYYL